MLESRLDLATAWAGRTGKPEWRREAAVSLLRRGNMHYEGGELDKTIDAYRQASPASSAGEGGRALAHREDLLRGVTDLAQVLSESGEHRAALEQQERAEAIVRALSADRPDDTELGSA